MRIKMSDREEEIAVSDVREQLVKFFEAFGWEYVSSTYADAILERFDVTPKPAVTEKELGKLVVRASHANGMETGAGAKLLELLAEAGLKIVRVDDHD